MKKREKEMEEKSSTRTGDARTSYHFVAAVSTARSGMDETKNRKLICACFKLPSSHPVRTAVDPLSATVRGRISSRRKDATVR